LDKIKILVIDDELLIRDLLYDFFAEKGWDVAVADTSNSGLELLRSRHFDFALVDLKMPEFDGIELIRKLRAIYPDLPIAIITAFPSFETAVEALRLKVNDYFTKPFNINHLFKTICNIVEESKKNRKSREESVHTREFQ